MGCFLYRKPDQNRLTHTIPLSPVAGIYNGTLPSPSLLSGPTRWWDRWEAQHMSQERNATGSPRTWARCPAGRRPQQCRRCPSQEGWNVDAGQLDPSANKQTKGLHMGQEEGWEMGLWERGRQCALTELFKVLDPSQLPVCQMPKGASNTRLIPSRESWFRGSTKKKIDPVMIRFPVHGRCCLQWPRLVLRAPVSHVNHYPFLYCLVCCKSSTNTSCYHCCCRHSYYKWRE